MLQACQVYIVVIQLFLIYGVIAWHHPQLSPLMKSTSIGIIDKLVKQQNKCIHLIAGIYKVISMSIVEAEVFISLLNLHLDLVIARAIKRMVANRMTCQIEVACTVIRRKLHHQ